MTAELQPGIWYIVVTCKQCNEMILLFRDLTKGQGTLNATYRVTCPRCNHRGEYEGRHYQHAGEG